MRLIGFNLTKIYAERKGPNTQDLKISNKIDIPNIEETKSDSFKFKEDLVSIDFSLIIDYAPEIAKIEICGRILLGLDSKMAKSVLNDWKEKKVSEDFKITLFNLILRKASIKAIQLEEEMGLPLHIQLPFARKQDMKENQE